MTPRMRSVRAPPAPIRESIFGTNVRAWLTDCLMLAHLASEMMSPLPRCKDVAMDSSGGPAHAPWKDEPAEGHRSVKRRSRFLSPGKKPLGTRQAFLCIGGATLGGKNVSGGLVACAKVALGTNNPQGPE